MERRNFVSDLDGKDEFRIITKYDADGNEVSRGIEYFCDQARVYDSSTGRWLNQDPMGFDAGDGNFFRYPYQPDQNY
jgi:RHS repeat-associated protein